MIGSLRPPALCVFLLLAAGASFAVEQPQSRRQAAAAWSEDGLEKIRIPGLDLAYARPGTSLGGYEEVLIQPVSVAFRRDWQRDTHADAGIRRRADHLVRLKTRMAGVIGDEVRRELERGGYRIATAPGEDVLELELDIVNLSLVASSNPPTAGRIEVYAVSAAEMTIVAELRDSSSGETLMRLYDHERGNDVGPMRLITDVESEYEVQRIAGAWARAVRRQLDLAKAGRAR